MIKLLIKGFLLIASVWATALGITRYDNREIVKDKNIIRINAAGKFDNLDILFVGSSYVYSGIVPEIFDSSGLSIFNLGISTTGAYYTDLLIEDYLKRGKTGKICIGISYSTFSEVASDIWHLYPIHRYLHSPMSNEQVTLKYKSYNGYYKMLRKSFKKGMKNMFTDAGGIDSSLYFNLVRDKGSELITDSVTGDIFEKEKKYFTPYLSGAFSTAKAACLLETIKSCKEKGISVIVFEPPTNYLHQYFNKEYISEYNAFKKILRQSVNIIECDASEYNLNCFRNTDHLNSTGAKKFSAHLLKELKKEI